MKNLKIPMDDSKKKIRILIADNHQIMLDGLRSILSSAPDIVIIAEARNGIEVLDKIQFDEIDVAVIDVSMPELDGHETVLRMKKSHPHIKLLILSFDKKESTIIKLIRAGVDGYVTKQQDSEELVKAIRSLAAGIEYFDADVKRINLQAWRNPEKVVQLTRRETDVLKLLAQGMTSKQIAKILSISADTVESHKKNMIHKLNLPSAQQLRIYAVHKFKDSK